MGTQSKYAQTKRSRVPSRKRTISVHGSGDDDGKWYRCWNCGFINNVDRNTVGEGEGLAYSIAVHDNEMKGEVGLTIGTSGISVLMTEQFFDERHNVAPDAVSGCSMCGSRNYR